MKKYCLVLHRNTFLWTKGEDGLVYSTSDKPLCFRFQNVGVLKRVTEDLLQIQNLYRVSITEDELNDKGVKVAEEGTHKELTERKGLYYKLVKNQLELGN